MQAGLCRALKEPDLNMHSLPASVSLQPSCGRESPGIVLWQMQSTGSGISPLDTGKGLVCEN